METIRVWRICHRKFKKTAFSGEGARLYGGRFNSEGNAVVYTSGSLSLSLLELIVQMNDRSQLKDCVIFSADIPVSAIWEPSLKELPDDWNNIPYLSNTQKFGDNWIQSKKTAAMRIPSVVVPIEFNYVINPFHREFSKIRISDADDFSFDERITG